ncbi:hypothetical protein K435DRAFT_880835 [Dendrothele bispora CBS 962.96]|uniref:Uncharacterized protein n=1 Tax=Dendrothele bispora (strain CBS 962.96) TaxID=1314807 RepID=A0A4S8KIZ4_DENBC|nr:hypothetical protein K435DRAFT_880835 [Dendrothele bispora CBS 962.96]
MYFPTSTPRQLSTVPALPNIRISRSGKELVFMTSTRRNGKVYVEPKRAVAVAVNAKFSLIQMVGPGQTIALILEIDGFMVRNER